MAERTCAQEASDYFNSLPFEQRKRLAPLLDDYRRMGLVEARDVIRRRLQKLDARIGELGAILDTASDEGEKPT
jgi:hypothetical protein